MLSPVGRLSCLAVLVLAVISLVYVDRLPALARRGPVPEKAKAQADHAKPAPSANSAEKPLPMPVEEMRQGILAAAHSGNIEDLKVPFEWNELPPELAATKVDDPIAFWKKTSGDGEGREILAVLANMLQMRPAELPLGKDFENNIIYVWPYLAETPLDKLTPAEEVDLLRLVSPAEAKIMREKNKWTWWRLTIGADGTWHSFKKAE